MALALVRRSIEVDQRGTVSARARVSLVSWEGGSHVVFFMVSLGPPGARSMAQVLRLPFEYYYVLYIDWVRSGCKSLQLCDTDIICVFDVCRGSACMCNAALSVSRRIIVVIFS